MLLCYNVTLYVYNNEKHKKTTIYIYIYIYITLEYPAGVAPDAAAEGLAAVPGRRGCKDL